MDDFHLFNRISRSHSYWGRKPLSGIMLSLSDYNKGEVLVDPFCGGGTAVLAALFKGGRVIASDLNPMAVFLTRVLCRPVGISALFSAFAGIKSSVADLIDSRYDYNCPECGQRAEVLFFRWQRFNDRENANGIKIYCKFCHKYRIYDLSPSQSAKITAAANIIPTNWFPKSRIKSFRKTDIEFHSQLFTGRNLTSLSDLYHKINRVQPDVCKEALLYVFTSILYSCSKMQMSSEKYPDSSQGWTALRYYIPPRHMEKNVWRVFEKRFWSFLELKKELNQRLPDVRIADTLEQLKKGRGNLYLFESDISNYLYQLAKSAKRVFLDPPYNVDMDYLGFSEFWGSWLKMKFPRNQSLIPLRGGVHDYLMSLKKILTTIRKETSNETRVTLAFGLKLKNAFIGIEEVIHEAGYKIISDKPVLYNSDRLVNTVKPKNYKKVDTYFELKPEAVSYSSDHPHAPIEPISTGLREALFYLRTMAYLSKTQNKVSNSRDILSNSQDLLPSHKASVFRQLPQNPQELESFIENSIKDSEANRKSYNEFVLRLINIIVKADGYKICYLNPLYFNDSAASFCADNISFKQNDCILADCSFVAQNKTQKIGFCFDNQIPDTLPKIAETIYNAGHISFSTVAILILPDDRRMKEVRSPEYAVKWQRGFFVSLKEIQKQAFKISPNDANLICSSPNDEILNTDQLRPTSKDISLYKAEILDQVAVGLSNPPSHYKLKFKLNALQNILPGQFIMLSTRALPPKNVIRKTITLNSINKIGKNQMAELGEKPISYLKRPFGIHRAFYPYFERNYLKQLTLPPQLSNILHTVFPHQFDILYKVLDNGIGTKELRNLKEGNKIEILGPLGKGYNPRFLCKSEIDEVHVIGGGVGMAPLLFMVQALKLFGFKVVAFIGIESIDMLRLQSTGENIESYGENAEDYQLYVNDLLEIGLSKDDIFVSFDKIGTTTPNIKNYKRCLISDYYSRYLGNLNRSEKIYGFTCGPTPMMKAIVGVANKYNNIKMHILRERRMACGIGVCFSCICKIKSQTSKDYDYSRVCIDGPIYKAEEIIFEE